MTSAQLTQATPTSIYPLIKSKSTKVISGSVFRNSKFQSPSLEKVWLPTMSGYVHLLLNDICYFKSDNMITRLYKTDGQTVCVNESLKTLEEALGPKGFVRTHKSYMVNMYNISKYVKKEGGYVIMECGARVPISRRNKWKLRLDD